MPALVLAAVVGTVVTALRLLSMSGFSNDHFFYLSRASQMLTGAWPVRDFVDPGFPLALVTSALAQLVGGPTLLSEAVLVAAAFGLGAALSAWVIVRWLGSVPLALWAAFVQVAVAPRSYSYPKILMFALAALACASYAHRPSRARLVGLAAMTAVAFLFRHDHGLYIGIAACVLVGGMQWHESPGQALRAVGLLAAVTLLMVTPYILYVQLNGGVLPYLAEGLHFSSREADRTWTLLPWFMDDAAVWSAAGLSTLGYYVLWLVPAVAGIAAWRRRGTGALVAAFIGMAMLANAGFLRDPLASRLPDAVVPFTLIAAWLVMRVWQGPWRIRALESSVRVAAILSLAVTATAAAEIGNFGEVVRRTELTRGPARALAHWRSLRDELRAPYEERQMPSDLAYALVPFYEHLQTCTPPDARILVTGFAPEIAYYARRGFAGGHPSLYRGYWSSDASQQRIVERLQHETVPFIVASPEGVEQFAESFPLVQSFVMERYVALADFDVDGYETPARLYVHRNLVAGPSAGESRWPCMTPQAK